MKKILHLYKDYLPTVGGVQNVIKGIAELTADRFSHIILTTHPSLCGWHSFSEADVYYCRVRLNVFSTPVSLEYLRMAVRLASDADIICCHYPYPLTDLAVYLMPEGKKIIYFWHSEIISQKITAKLFTPFIKSGLKRASAVAVSSPVMAENSDILRPRSNKIFVCPYGVDYPNFSTEDEEDKASVAEIKNYYGSFILGVGRLVPYKGFEYLIRAMEYLPDRKLIIIGSGRLEPELNSLISKHNLSDRVFILKNIDNKKLKAFYHSCALFCFPSCMKSEAFGMAQLEAMASGCAIVNTDVGSGVNWVARKDIEACTAENKSPESLAACMHRILDDEQYAEGLQRAAQKRASWLMSLEAWRDRLMTVFE